MTAATGNFTDSMQPATAALFNQLGVRLAVREPDDGMDAYTVWLLHSEHTRGTRERISLSREVCLRIVETLERAGTPYCARDVTLGPTGFKLWLNPAGFNALLAAGIPNARIMRSQDLRMAQTP